MGSTEEELRERLAQAIHDSDDAIDTAWPLGPDDDGKRGDRQHVRLCRWPEMYLTAADAVIRELGIPMSVLAWITANPEAAKGLASGEMVAVWAGAAFGNPSASPAPSGKAQGDEPVDVHAIKVGDKLELALPENGYPHEQEQARAFVGRVLTVKTVDMGGWHTSLTFEEIGGKWNSVQFRGVRP